MVALSCAALVTLVTKFVWALIAVVVSMVEVVIDIADYASVDITGCAIWVFILTGETYS